MPTELLGNKFISLEISACGVKANFSKIRTSPKHF